MKYTEALEALKSEAFDELQPWRLFAIPRHGCWIESADEASSCSTATA